MTIGALSSKILTQSSIPLQKIEITFIAIDTRSAPASLLRVDLLVTMKPSSRIDFSPFCELLLGDHWVLWNYPPKCFPHHCIFRHKPELRYEETLAPLGYYYRGKCEILCFSFHFILFGIVELPFVRQMITRLRYSFIFFLYLLFYQRINKTSRHI